MHTTPFGMKDLIEHITEHVTVMHGEPLSYRIKVRYIYGWAGSHPKNLAELVLQQARVGVREQSGALRGFRHA
jgi:hypothetical protein